MMYYHIRLNVSLFFIIIGGFYFQALGSGINPAFLRVENLIDPLGIDAEKPRLSWYSESEERGQYQTAYRILVASSLETLNKNVGDLWDSKKVSSGESINIEYRGTKLEYANRCYWKIMLWDRNDKPSDWSNPGYWTMGFLKSTDCNAIWIGFDREMEGDDSDAVKTRCAARYIRKEFDFEKPVKYATVSFSGQGSSELFINGSKVSNAVLSPALTQYPDVAAYVTYEITEELKEGKNAFGVVLGNGRYFAPRLNHERADLFILENYGFPKLILQAKILFEDGSSVTVKTDHTWRLTNQGPILANNEFDGEKYDARKELEGWSEPGYDDSSWTRSEVVPAAGEILKAQMMNPIRVTETLKPISVKEIKPGTYIYDMGQNMVGWARLKVRGKRGTTVRMRFAEALQADGSLYLDNLRKAEVTDTYICKGDIEEIYEPRFTYHGFRYVELTGFPGKPDLNTLEGRVVNDDLEVTGSFRTSNETINQIYHNSYWGIRGNYRSLPTDCPQRDERQGWLGDRSVNSRGESYIFDNSALYAKWMDDIKYSQKEDGTIPVVAPTYWDTRFKSISWPSSYIFIPKMLYDQFGDERVIRNHYPGMKKWFNFIADNFMDNYLLEYDTWGDWCMPPDDPEIIHSTDPSKITSKLLLSTSFFYQSAKLLEEFAELQGFEEDQRYFKEISSKISQAYNETLFSEEEGYYANNTVTSNVVSLAFGLVPSEYEEKVFDHIVKKTEYEHNGHISTGLIGGLFIMRTLTKYGRPDLAYRMVTNRDYPSWGYMIEEGATTIWELWNGNTAEPSMNSRNHVMLIGDMLIWFYEHLAGIKSQPYQVFKQLDMKLTMPDGLNFVDASYRSPYGKIKSNWKRSDGDFKWTIEIPSNTSAKISFPLKYSKNLQEGGKELADAAGIEVLGENNNYLEIKISSGNYSFTSLYD